MPTPEASPAVKARVLLVDDHALLRTGVANIIVRPDLFARDRLLIVDEPFLIVEGMLQNEDGVTSVRAEDVRPLRGVNVDFDAHDFY